MLDAKHDHRFAFQGIPWYGCEMWTLGGVRSSCLKGITDAKQGNGRNSRYVGLCHR